VHCHRRIVKRDIEFTASKGLAREYYTHRYNTKILEYFGRHFRFPYPSKRKTFILVDGGIPLLYRGINDYSFLVGIFGAMTVHQEDAKNIA